MARARHGAPALTLAQWEARLESAITGDSIVSVYQPIVDTAQGTVVGYEALSRFQGADGHGPDAWFAAATTLGRGPELEAAALAAALAKRPTLPRNCFLSVNMGPDVAAHPMVRKVLAAEGDLSGLVIELTEHAPVDSYAALDAALRPYRVAGALIAVDDAGSGHAGLQHLLELRPAIIKLDRQLISDIHVNEAKRALVEMLGTFADHLDSWLLAEGVEQGDELLTLTALDVPLVQGYFLGRPGAPWVTLEPDAAAVMARARTRRSDSPLGQLVEALPAVGSLTEAGQRLARDRDLDAVVVLDEHGHPTSVVDPRALSLGAPVPALVVSRSTSVAAAARRVLTRPRAVRFLPLAVTDDVGRYVGAVRVERLLESLASPAHQGEPVPTATPTDAGSPRS